MHCETHPNYKGTKYPGKRNQNCPICQAIYKKVQDSQDKWNPYRSITTPDFKCDLIHLLAELSTVMIFGQQPALFWRKDTPAAGAAKEHFSKTYNQLKAWLKRNPETFKGLKAILHHIFTQHWMGFEGEAMRHDTSADTIISDVPTTPVMETTLNLERKPSIHSYFDEGVDDGKNQE